MAFRNASNRRIAGHLSNEINIEGVKSSLQTHPGASHGGLAASVSSPDDNYVELLGKLHARYILQA
jgi:hypothetical protein